MSIIFLIFTVFVSWPETATAENTSGTVSGNPLPDDLKEILLETPETVRPSHYPELIEWLNKAKRGMQSTVVIRNPEFSASDISLFGNLEVERSQLDNFEHSCGQIRAGYFWLEIKMQAFQRLLKMTEELTPLMAEANSQKSAKMFERLFLYVLEYRDQLLQIEKDLPRQERLLASYHWTLGKGSLVETIHPFAAVKVTGLVPEHFMYPGVNWSRQQSIPLSAIDMVRAPLAYDSGGIHFSFAEDLRSLCQDQFYFRLVTAVDYSFESIPAGDIAERKTISKTRSLTLHGHIVRGDEERIAHHAFSLKYLRELVLELNQLSQANDSGSAFRFLQKLDELASSGESCAEVHKDSPKQSSVTCSQIARQMIKFEKKRQNFLTSLQEDGGRSSENGVADYGENSQLSPRYWRALMQEVSAGAKR
ncbi:hypothetical protein N9D31_01375 [Oligoflexaceae bacterium]|nr:hypothetical protein [Oligoflexaceae bacterium]